MTGWNQNRWLQMATDGYRWLQVKSLGTKKGWFHAPKGSNLREGFHFIGGVHEEKHRKWYNSVSQCLNGKNTVRIKWPCPNTKSKLHVNI